VSGASGLDNYQFSSGFVLFVVSRNCLDIIFTVLLVLNKNLLSIKLALKKKHSVNFILLKCPLIFKIFNF